MTQTNSLFRMIEKKYSKEELRVKFRKDILESSDNDFGLKRVLLVRTLDYFSDFNEKEQYLRKEISVLQNTLAKNYYSIWLPYQGILKNIEKCLDSFYNGNTIYSKVKGVEFDERVSKGEQLINAKNAYLSVYPLKPLLGDESYFNFAELNSNKDVIEYISNIEYLHFLREELKKYSPKLSESNDKSKIESVITTISESCKEIVANPELFHTLNKHFEDQADKQRENYRTAHLISKFNNKSSQYIIKNQHLTGQSETKNSTGTVDFAVFFNKEIITIGEAVNSSVQNTKSIDRNIVRHLKKLTQNYNLSTLSDLILLVYYEGNPEKFFDSYCNYQKHFAKSTEQVIKSTKSIDDISLNIVTNSSSIKIAKSIHSYSGNDENEFTIYHFYIDFSEK